MAPKILNLTGNKALSTRHPCMFIHHVLFHSMHGPRTFLRALVLAFNSDYNFILNIIQSASNSFSNVCKYSNVCKNLFVLHIVLSVSNLFYKKNNKLIHVLFFINNRSWNCISVCNVSFSIFNIPMIYLLIFFFTSSWHNTFLWLYQIITSLIL